MCIRMVRKTLVAAIFRRQGISLRSFRKIIVENTKASGNFDLKVFAYGLYWYRIAKSKYHKRYKNAQVGILLQWPSSSFKPAFHIINNKLSV